MSEQEFLDKWHDFSCQGIWCENSSHLFWARSYKMPENLLLEMSGDFLSIPEIASVSPRHYDSSIDLARHTLGRVMMG